jgi:hypothetical protein
VLTALTPLGLAAPRRAWLAATTLYFTGGVVASACVGAALGGLGAALGVDGGQRAVVGALLILGAAVVARELGWIMVPWPQPRRASNGSWARRFGVMPAAALWGLDIGALFTTWMTYAGAWWLVALAVGFGEVIFGIALLAAYWLGRALSLWLGPAIVPTATVLPWVATVWIDLHPSFRRVHAAAVSMGCVALVLPS